MKKNRLFTFAGTALLAGSLVLLAACSDTHKSETPVNDTPPAAVSSTQVLNSITAERAVEIALAHAGVTNKKAKFTKTQLDSDDAVPNYEIEFVADGYEYDYEIAVADGKIIRAEYEKPDALPGGESKPSESEATKPKETAKSNGYISVDSAKAAALKDAGVNEADAVFEKAVFDGNDLIPHYDIEFYANGYEYDYEIHAEKATVIEKDKERERTKPTASSDGYITAEQAIAAAEKHSGVKAEGNAFAELDTDDAISHYDVEFVSGNREYEYEINAKSGAVIAYEKDRRD